MRNVWEKKIKSYRVLVGKPEGSKETLSVDGTIILKEILKKQKFIANLFRLAQDRGKWHAFLNTVTNCQVPQDAGKFLK
jgi:hypothetical protein